MVKLRVYEFKSRTSGGLVTVRNSGLRDVGTPMFDIAFSVLMVFMAWQITRVRYQRAHIALLGQHLSALQLERHMETLTNGYNRAIHESDAARQLQVLATFASTEQMAATQLQSLADSMQKEAAIATRISMFHICVPYVERLFPNQTRDFRELLKIHATGLRDVVDNEQNWDPKSRAYHLMAELYLFQHSCHWYCKSRNVADARLMLRHQVKHEKVLESVSDRTRAAYLRWLETA